MAMGVWLHLTEVHEHEHRTRDVDACASAGRASSALPLTQRVACGLKEIDLILPLAPGTRYRVCDPIACGWGSACRAREEQPGSAMLS
jgi:hypothetical protein